MCAGILHDPCALNSIFVKKYDLASPLAILVSTGIRPVFHSFEAVVFSTLRKPGQQPEFLFTLPRPPPSFA